MTSGIILFAHGSRTAGWAEPFERIRARVAAKQPEAHVSLAYLELMSPDLATAIDGMADAGVGRISVVPLFLAPGGHVRGDLPRLVDAALERHPALRIRLLPPIGESDALLNAIADWAADGAFDG